MCFCVWVLWMSLCVSVCGCGFVQGIDRTMADANSAHTASKAAHVAADAEHRSHEEAQTTGSLTQNSTVTVASPGSGGEESRDENGHPHESRGPPVMQHPLRRAGSNSSLVSVAPGNVYSKDAVSGMVHLMMQFEPTPGGMSPRSNRTIGVVKVHVSECRNLPASQPYVKLYISNQSQDLKSTKRKTKSKKAPSPAFNESFEFPIKSEAELDDSRRLQLSVWDHARLRANECTGGMSFSLAEIASSSQISGWFELLSTTEGRLRHERVTVDPDQSSDEAAVEPASVVKAAAGTPSTCAHATAPPAFSNGVGTASSTHAATSSRVPTSRASTVLSHATPVPADREDFVGTIATAVPADAATAAVPIDVPDAVRAEIAAAKARIDALVEEVRDTQAQVDDIATEKSAVEKALAERTAELWALMETNAEHIGKLSEVGDLTALLVAVAVWDEYDGVLERVHCVGEKLYSCGKSSPEICVHVAVCTKTVRLCFLRTIHST